ncbi:hypothetical protein KY290_022586 [Solanum tuberosum]|uniref:Retrotransposon gag domain-containing protein n=1 Tax=Solanum tuberosum TaxID=4113 RepID=A0ABQ7V4U5_SOLTU|nr:hypothetical protein KY289_021703 [Solanum tuberosum]KAH0759093.1 hypothetical protein KY290_022586 [Solanum tuberosum]
MGFLNGKCKKPAQDDPRVNQWERCDGMVTSWILHSLSKDIADSLQYVNNAAELWQELKDRYDQTNGAKLYQLQKEISDLVQGSMDVTTYYTKMKRLWEELGTLDISNQCNCVCVCGAKTTIHKAEQDRRLIQFLMGLNEVYTVVRGSILIMNPLPTIAQGFSILIQEEKHREVKPRSHLTMEGTSLNAHGGNQFRTNYNTQYNSNTGNRYSQQSGNFQQKGSSSGLRLFCDYCKKPGHIKDKCYRLHGFLPNFKFTKGKNTATAAAVHGESGESFTGHHEDTNSQGGGSNTLQHLTKDQQSKLMHLLESFQEGSTCEALNNINITSGAANFAGILACSTYSEIMADLSSKCCHSPADLWILDSGASNHMSYNKNLLTNIRTLPYHFLVTLPNGYKAHSMKRPMEIGRA